jgi:hypothetical protein
MWEFWVCDETMGKYLFHSIFDKSIEAGNRGGVTLVKRLLYNVRYNCPTKNLL